MGQIIDNGESLSGRSASGLPSGGTWPAGVPLPDIHWDAQDLVDAGVADEAEVGHNANGTEWVDKIAGYHGQVATDTFLPNLEHAVSGFSGGNEPGVRNIAASPNFDLLNIDNGITEINWPLDGDGNSDATMAFIGRIEGVGTILGDNNSSLNPAHKFGLGNAGGGNHNWVIGGSSSVLNLGTFSDPTFPWNFIVIIGRDHSTDWNCWNNGVKVGEGLGTHGVAHVWQRLLRARPQSGSWPAVTWRCRHMMFWQSYFFSDADATSFNSFFNGLYAIY